MIPIKIIFLFVKIKYALLPLVRHKIKTDVNKTTIMEEIMKQVWGRNKVPTNAITIKFGEIFFNLLNNEKFFFNPKNIMQPVAISQNLVGIKKYAKDSFDLYMYIKATIERKDNIKSVINKFLRPFCLFFP